MLSATDSSGTSPSALRSSGTSPTPAVMAAAGVHRRTGASSTLIDPESTGSAPNRARTVSLRPEPSSPARPTTSPACTATSTPARACRRVSPTACSTGPPARSVCPAPKRVRPCSRTSSTPRPSIIATNPSRSVATDRAVVHPAAVAQHGDPLGQPEDLVQLVCDVQHGDAVGAQHPDHLGQPVDLPRLQRRRRLVHDHAPTRRWIPRGPAPPSAARPGPARRAAAGHRPRLPNGTAARERPGAARRSRSGRSRPSGSRPRKRLRATLSCGTRFSSW